MTKILIDKATVMQVLDALDNLMYWDNGKSDYDEAREASAALREALAGHVKETQKFEHEPAQQEPVAYPYLVNCTSCGEEKKVERGNHHPWCFCGSDSFDWGNSRDLPEQQDIQRLSALVRAQQITIDKLEAQRTWVGLTDEQIDRLWSQSLADTESETWLPLREFARAIEAAHDITGEQK